MIIVCSQYCLYEDFHNGTSCVAGNNFTLNYLVKLEMGLLARAVSGDFSDKGPLELINLECVNRKNLEIFMDLAPSPPPPPAPALTKPT